MNLPVQHQEKLRMRNLPAPTPASRRGSNAGLASTLASPNQSRYKGLISTPGITKFSAWKRENELPKYDFATNFYCNVNSCLISLVN